MCDCGFSKRKRKKNYRKNEKEKTDIQCLNTSGLWGLRNLKRRDVVACLTSTVGQVKAAVQLIISVLRGPASGFE